MSGRRYGRSEMRQDLAWAGARAAESQWAAAERENQATACEADPSDVEGYDFECRFRNHPLHTCVTRDMVPVHGYQICWYEARAQLAEQGDVLHAAEGAVQP